MVIKRQIKSHQTNLAMNRIKHLLVAFVLLNVSLWSGCYSNYISDVNVSMPKHRWSYIDKITTVVDVKDHTKPYDLFFKLRHTAAYSYGNIFILFHYQAPGKKAVTRRYQYQLASPDGKWLGSGSGDLFTYTLPLLTGFKFPANGKYTLVIEQSMVDNPLHGISDGGIRIVKQQQ